MLTFALYAGSHEGKNPVYREQAAELGGLLAQHECTVKFGGTPIGLMHAFAQAFNKAAADSASRAELYAAITKKYYRNQTRAELGCDFRLTNTLRLRKHLLVDKIAKGKRKTDAFICLPGGTGTLDELFESVEIDAMAKARGGKGSIRPIFLLNTAGYYNHQIAQLRFGQTEGFIKEDGLDFLKIALDAQTLYKQIRQVFQLP